MMFFVSAASVAFAVCTPAAAADRKSAEYAQCIAKRNPERAKRVLDAYLAQPYRRNILLEVTDFESCQAEGFFSPDGYLVAGSLARAFLPQDIQRDISGPVAEEQMPKALAFDAPFLTCTLMAAPGEVDALIKSPVEAKAERLAMAAVLVRASPCLEKRRNRSITRDERGHVRASLTLAAYALTRKDGAAK